MFIHLHVKKEKKTSNLWKKLATLKKPTKVVAITSPQLISERF